MKKQELNRALYVIALRQGDEVPPLTPPSKKSSWLKAATEHMDSVSEQILKATDLHDIMSGIRSIVRNIMGADGVTFVLRDGDHCYYAEEDAITPLWKGQRFPLTNCISGWAMLHKMPAIIEDIYKDERIPHDAYRPTFVKSLVMMPVSGETPVAAIGTYWARTYRPGNDEVALLAELANIAGKALTRVDLSPLLNHKPNIKAR